MNALDDAVMCSGEAHQNQMMQYMNNKQIQEGFGRVVIEIMLRNMASKRRRTSSIPPARNT